MPEALQVKLTLRGVSPLVWRRLVVNASIADALDHPDYRTLYIEVLRVADALSIQPEAFNGFDPQAFMPDTPEAVSQQSIDEMVAFNRKSAKTHSGIWRCVHAVLRLTRNSGRLFRRESGLGSSHRLQKSLSSSFTRNKKPRRKRTGYSAKKSSLSGAAGHPLARCTWPSLCHLEKILTARETRHLSKGQMLVRR